MQDNEEVYPEANYIAIFNKIKAGQKSYPSLQAYVIELIWVLDKNGDNLISFDEFSAGIAKMGIVLTDHEIHMLVWKFDHNKDGKISMEEFYNTLAAVA